MSDPTHPMRAVDRIAAILGCFSSEVPLLTLTEIAGQSGLDKNTARRLLLALCGTGLVWRAPGGEYGLGTAIVRMQPAVVPVRALRETAAPWLQEVTQHTGLTAFAWQPDPEGALCVERARVHQVFTELHWSSAGSLLPLHLAAGPRTILAHLPQDRRRAWLDRPLIARTPWSETDAEALDLASTRIRAQGYEHIADDLVVGLAGLGVPLFDRGGALAGALSVTGPTGALADAGRFQTALAALKAAAAAIGVRLGP